MRIAHFSIDGRAAWGVEDGAELIELRLGAGLAGLLARPPERLAELADAAPSGQRHARNRGEMLCPAAGCGKILGIGMNYRDGVTEALAAGINLPSETIWFGRPLSTLCGPSDPVWFPPDCDDLDYEGELVIVIGKRCHRVGATGARAVIGGYAVGNDVTMRQRALRSAVLGKSYDNQAPVGQHRRYADGLRLARCRVERRRDPRPRRYHLHGDARGCRCNGVSTAPAAAG